MKLFVSALLRWFSSTDLGDVLHPQPEEATDSINLVFQVGCGALAGYISPDGVSVTAVLGDECFDRLFDDDLIAERSSDGWSCSLCLPGHRRWYATIEELWQAHLFEPLRRWVDDELLPADGIAFYARNGVTLATLERADRSTERIADFVRFQAIR